MMAAMAVRRVCLWSVLLLAPTLWTLGATQISVGFSDTELKEAEDKQVLIAIVHVEVPEGLDISGFGDLTVHVTSENGEAIAGEDFEAVDWTTKLTNEVLHNIQTYPGSGDRIVRIPLTEDDYTEGAETFTLTLEAHPAVDMKADSATITITDSNKPVDISFDHPTYTAYTSEDTPLKVKVLKTGRIQENIAVNVIFSNGPSTQTIRFKPSQDTFDISFHEHVSNDATYSLSLALADPSQNLEGLVVFGAAAEVKVTDFTPEDSHILMVLKGLLEKKLNESIEHLQAKYDDLELKYNRLQETIGLAVWFDQNDYTVRESDRTVRVCLRKNLKTSEVISVTVTAKESSPASATGGVDFSTDPRKITIPAGSEETACTDIDIITDDSVALEGNETFTLTLTVDDHSPPVTSAATVTIIDDDGVKVNLTDKVFVAQRYTSDYNSDYAWNKWYRVQVCLSINTTFDGYLKVPLVLSHADTETGPAIQNASVTFYGSLRRCEQIKIIPSEWPLKLEIGSALPDHVVAGSPSTATVDGLAVWFEQSRYTVQEDNKVRVCLKKSLKTSEDLFVTVTAKDLYEATYTCASCATGGKDFSTDPQTITIPAGSEEAAHCKDLDIIIDDTATERTETFTLTLTVEDHPGVTSSARVTIRDNDYNNYSTDYRDHYVAYHDRDKWTYMWVIVAVVAIVVIILAVAVAACVIYHQRTKIKDCFASPYKYKKLPTDIHIETITF